jgi:hypothetical protein
MGSVDISDESAQDARELQIAGFLKTIGWAEADRGVLARDASYRTYDRLRRGDETAVLMNAPPGLEEVGPFLDIAAQLHRFGYSAPRILAKDEALGLLLIEDLGDRTFSRILADGGDETTLYELATDLLIDLHQRAPTIGFNAPPYNIERLAEEADRVLRWYLPLYTGEVDADLQAEFAELWRENADILCHGPTTLVLRDFHVDNLMILEGRAGVARCGLLDFQDALAGPVAYDLVSLLQDARRDLTPGLEAAMLERYRAATAPEDWEAFLRGYHALGAQRAIKIIGVFGRQLGFFGRTQYLKHLPRLWAHAMRDLERAGLGDVIAWLDRNIPATYREIPDDSARLPASLSPVIQR